MEVTYYIFNNIIIVNLICINNLIWNPYINLLTYIVFYIYFK